MYYKIFILLYVKDNLCSREIFLLLNRSSGVVAKTAFLLLFGT
jgi:hypothetical protein